MHKESGLVSILTVIIFMIFVSILVVGFIKIMADEQRQTTDNDLSASALTAAQSGVEDAKRVILYCLGSGLDLNDTNRCNNIFGSGRASDPCDSFKNGSKGLFQSMGIQYDTNTNEAVVGNPDFNQYYTCLSVTSDPGAVEKTVTAGDSEFIPMNVNGTYDSIAVNWSDDTGTWGQRALTTGTDFTTLGTWRDMSGNPRPPVLRVQIIPYPVSGGINLDQVEQNSDSFFLVPATGGAATTSISRTLDNRNAAGSPRTVGTPLAYTTCVLGSGVSGYDCTMKITGFTPATEQYYVRLSLLYGMSTKVTVSPIDTPAGNTPRTFNNVQYVIDVTGRANDVYRRVQSRVSPKSAGVYPEYAVDTAQRLCKDIIVADAATTQYCP